MDQKLWSDVILFEFDKGFVEYGFALRLANENYWTQNFTQRAILEYKKFMYLAATQNEMVSPSEIVDAVWHLHLTYTQSYQALCDVLGKRIEHVPSTHKRSEQKIFKDAKERTKILYRDAFGEQPADIWNFMDMYQHLHLGKARLHIRTFIAVFILSFLLLLIPAIYLGLPLVQEIDNPDFLYIFFAISISAFVGLEIYNGQYLASVLRKMDPLSFILNLSAAEVIYLKTQDLVSVISTNVNKLIVEGQIVINSDQTFTRREVVPASLEEYQILQYVPEDDRKVYYPVIASALKGKPVYKNTARCMDALRKYVNKSKMFGDLYYNNFIMLSIPFMLGLIRLYGGITRDKPVFFLILALLLFAVGFYYHVQRLLNKFGAKTIPNFYKTRLRKETKEEPAWAYLANGRHAFDDSFAPLAVHAATASVFMSQPTVYSSGDGSSCGTSSDGDGGGCGGCGGD